MSISKKFFGENNFSALQEIWHKFGYPFYIPENALHMDNNLKNPLTISLDLASSDSKGGDSQMLNAYNKFNILLKHLLEVEFC